MEMGDMTLIDEHNLSKNGIRNCVNKQCNEEIVAQIATTSLNNLFQQRKM